MKDWYDVNVITSDLRTHKHTILLASEEEAIQRMTAIYEDVTAVLVNRANGEEEYA